MKVTKLSESDLLQRLAQFNKGLIAPWVVKEGKLFKSFIFPNFLSAFDFMSICAQYAEKINHHPEWCNVYNKVEISLMTHDVSGISDKDFYFAQKIEEILST